VPAVQGVTDHEVTEHGGDAGAPVKEYAGVAGAADPPAVTGAEEGEGEVGGLREGACGRGGAVGRLRGVECSQCVELEEAEDGRGVEAPEAVKEATRGDDAAEGRAGGGGAGEVFRGVEAEEDLLQDLVGEDRLRCWGAGDPMRRRRGHGAATGTEMARWICWTFDAAGEVEWSGRKRTRCCGYGLDGLGYAMSLGAHVKGPAAGGEARHFLQPLSPKFLLKKQKV